jgi:hypothetical protein
LGRPARRYPLPGVLQCAKAGERLTARPAFFDPHWIYDRFVWNPNAIGAWSLIQTPGPFSKSRKIMVDSVARIASAEVRLRRSAHWKPALLVCGLRAGAVVASELMVPRPIAHHRPGRYAGPNHVRMTR